MNKLFSLFVVVLALVSLVAVSCNYRGETEPPFAEPPGGPLPGGTQISFTADRTSIQPGECVNLEWRIEGEGFFGVELNGQTVNPSGQKQVCPPETTVYTLALDIGTTMLNREVLVTVAGTGQQPSQPQTPGQPAPGQPPQQPSQPPSPGCPGAPVFTHFEAIPSTITAGQSTSLEWGPVTNGATGPLVGSVVLTPGNFGEVGSPGSRQVSPSSTTTYTLTATGCGGTATKSVTVVVPIVGTPIPIPIPSPNPPGGGGSWSGPPKVTNVTAQAVPPSYTGKGPTTANFVADITVDGPCTVTYKWERSDGASGQVQTLVFNAAGAQQTSDTWMLGGGPGTGKVWERVSILTPLPMLSNKAEFALTITP